MDLGQRSMVTSQKKFLLIYNKIIYFKYYRERKLCIKKRKINYQHKNHTIKPYSTSHYVAKNKTRLQSHRKIEK